MFALRCRETHGGHKFSLFLMSLSVWEVDSEEQKGKQKEMKERYTERRKVPKKKQRHEEGSEGKRKREMDKI